MQVVEMQECGATVAGHVRDLSSKLPHAIPAITNAHSTLTAAAAAMSAAPSSTDSMHAPTRATAFVSDADVPVLRAPGGAPLPVVERPLHQEVQTLAMQEVALPDAIRSNLEHAPAV
ncbi:hypothetical protein EON67_04895, partial [archaeon]